MLDKVCPNRISAARSAMKSKWDQDTAFPIIASVIERLYHGPDKYISKRDIVPVLLRDTHRRELIETKYKEKHRTQSIEE
jgi:hypothetical protein